MPEAEFMPDVPAHRSEDVAAELPDGRASIAFTQAENELNSAMSVLEWAIRG